MNAYTSWLWSVSCLQQVTVSRFYPFLLSQNYKFITTVKCLWIVSCYLLIFLLQVAWLFILCKHSICILNINICTFYRVFKTTIHNNKTARTLFYSQSLRQIEYVVLTNVACPEWCCDASGFWWLSDFLDSSYVHLFAIAVLMVQR